MEMEVLGADIMPPILNDQRIALRLNDAAAISGLSKSTLYSLIRAGKLNDCRVGSRRLILRADLEALIQGSVKVNVSKQY